MQTAHDRIGIWLVNWTNELREHLVHLRALERDPHLSAPQKAALSQAIGGLECELHENQTIVAKACAPWFELEERGDWMHDPSRTLDNECDDGAYPADDMRSLGHPTFDFGEVE